MCTTTPRPSVHPIARQRLQRATAVLTAILLAAPLLATFAQAAVVPQLDHVIVVIMENHSFGEVVDAPYISSLRAQGSTFTNSYAVTHPSQPNYLALWGGGTQGVTNDACPAPGSPFTTENLGHACEVGGVSWRAYSEDLPAAGSAVCTANGVLYARKHEPWTNWSNLTHLNERPYADLAADIAANTLPRLAFVVPNQCNDMHSCSVATGDTWLANNVPAMIQAVGPRGMVVITFDEDDNSAGNHILTLFVGGAVLGNYTTSAGINHYTLLRCLCETMGLAPFGAAMGQPSITDVWALIIPAATASWGSVKSLYK